MSSHRQDSPQTNIHKGSSWPSCLQTPWNHTHSPANSIAILVAKDAPRRHRVCQRLCGMCHDMWWHTIFLFIFTFYLSRVLLQSVTWLTWSHTLLSHVTHRLMTRVDLGWLIVTHWCFTFYCFIHICFTFCFMTHTRTSIVLVTYCSSDIIVLCDVYCSCDAIVHFTIKSGLLSSL